VAVFRVLRRLLQTDNPLSALGVKKLKGSGSQYRARSGKYRILFELDVTPTMHLKRAYKGTVIVQAIKQRKEAYRP
jgi:mRNA-degrading endonuclease RelE of RelBE toxin-antitoxin system